MDWLSENWMGLLLVWSSLVAAAQTIVRLTPTDKDDSIVGTIALFTEKVRNLLTFSKPSSPSKDQIK